ARLGDVQVSLPSQAAAGRDDGGHGLPKKVRIMGGVLEAERYGGESQDGLLWLDRVRQWCWFRHRGGVGRDVGVPCGRRVRDTRGGRPGRRGPLRQRRLHLCFKGGDPVEGGGKLGFEGGNSAVMVNQD